MNSLGSNESIFSRFTANYCRPGAAVLIVLLILSAVIVVCMNIWKSTALNLDLVIKRQEREQKFRIAEGVLNYGIYICCERFKTLKKLAKEGKKNIELDMGNWEIENKKPCFTKLKISLNSGKIDLIALVSEGGPFLQGGPFLSGISCSLERKTKRNRNQRKEKYFAISNWQTHV